MRLNRVKKFIIEKENDKRVVFLIFIVVPIIAIVIGYLISRIIVLPMIDSR